MFFKILDPRNFCIVYCKMFKYILWYFFIGTSFIIFLLEFNASSDNYSFKSVKAAEVLAAEIYKMNHEDYKKTKATVIQDIKHVTK